MPRKSADARSVQAVVNTAKLEPPDKMSFYARQYWDSITSTKPSDFFSEGNLPLLAQYCRVLVQLDRTMDAVEAANPSLLPTDYGELAANHAKMSALAISLATKLRLTIQSSLRGESAKNSERTKPSPLLGGVMRPH